MLIKISVEQINMCLRRDYVRIVNSLIASCPLKLYFNMLGVLFYGYLINSVDSFYIKGAK